MSLPSEARNHTVTWTSKCSSRKKDEIERTMTYISFIVKPCNMKFGMHLVKTLFYFTSCRYMAEYADTALNPKQSINNFVKPADYTYYTYFLFFGD